jgi:hypothetical protein
MSEESTEMETIKLPEWKSCYEDMLKDGIEYGKTYPTEFFEKKLRANRLTMEFGIAVSRVRTLLLAHGFYLSGRGGKGKQFVILAASANCQVMENFQVAAAHALHKGATLGRNTRLELLSSDERRKHESTLEKCATRLALFTRRTTTIQRALRLMDKKAAA